MGVIRNSAGFVKDQTKSAVSGAYNRGKDLSGSAAGKVADGARKTHEVLMIPREEHTHLATEILGDLYKGIHNSYHRVIDFFLTTPAEYPIGAAIFLGIALTVGYNKEHHRNDIFEIGFANTQKIVQEIGADKMDPFTTGFARANDVYNEVMLASNQVGGDANRYARELEDRCVSVTNDRPLLYAQIDSTLAGLDRMIIALEPLDRAQALIAPANKLLDGAWDYTHFDHTHPVTHYDSKGNVSWIETVYDGTSHSWNYEPEAGSRSVPAFQLFNRTYDGLDFKVDPKTARNRDPETDYEAERSRVGTKILSEEEKARIGALWATGSVVATTLPKIYGGLERVAAGTEKWAVDMPTAKSASAFTMSRWEEGPVSYQHAQELLHDGKELENNTGYVMEVLRKTRERMVRLRNKLELFQKEQLDQHHDASDLADNIRDQVREDYELLFPEGMKENKFRAWAVMLWGLAGATVGTAIGGLADYAGNRYAKRNREA